jgi:hypothetical protein
LKDSFRPLAMQAEVRVSYPLSFTFLQVSGIFRP